ncbi:MAG: tRNA (5-methylaminomethyl-2-thiouridine)(34)-methyltransferase MnmD [Methylophilaceae bacterium]
MQFEPINWINNNPYSIVFDDIYFSSDDGFAETEYVFIAQNRLKERFASLKNEQFTIIETGFGTGLNFYSTAVHFLALAPTDATLHYISIEKFPLSPSDMQKVASFWPQFAPITSEYLPKYAELKSGLNSINIAGSRISIGLQVDDILSSLAQITQKADAWFLDGFAPAKNAEMWSAEVLKQVSRLSKSGTTFATFTSAGKVRRDLQVAGFDVQKLAGFGKKREMLAGVFKS